jgi:hypothetical protein
MRSWRADARRAQPRNGGELTDDVAILLSPGPAYERACELIIVQRLVRVRPTSASEEGV